MSSDGNLAACRPAAGKAGSYRRLSAADDIAGYLEDAAHFPGGRCDEVCFPETEADVADVIAKSRCVLPIGVQSSLTGGATPMGGTIVSTERMNRVLEWGKDFVRVQPGLSLAELDESLRERDMYYPPAPTYDGASVGGVVSTNAAGAATFKYGATREWVRALTVVLADGDVLPLRRGDCVARDGRFSIVKSDGTVVELAVPDYVMPDVPKRSAGYFAAAAMDLIDLFVGAEGTLGMIVEVELAVASPRPQWLVGFVPVTSDLAAVAITRDLRRASTREGGTLDLAAVEYMDERCIVLLREDGIDSGLGFSIPAGARAALIFQVESPAERAAAAAEDLAAAAASGRGPYGELIEVLAGHDALDGAVVALPGDQRRRKALFGLREGVPEAVNRRIKQSQRDVDAAISKCAADPIVPFVRLSEALGRYREIAEAHGLDMAVWGHISDGNVHPNLLPRSAAELAAAKTALGEIGEAAIEIGGCPMSEHGVGRNPIKQMLLRRLYGAGGIEAMQAVKRALDPGLKLAPGVLFAVD